MSPAILMLIPIYSLGLMPATALLAWLCTRADAALGLSLPLPWPLRWIFFGVCVTAGGALVLWSYTYLVLEGEGGPVPPFSQHTRRLVTQGPYAVVRHPSIGGKLTGTIGLGLLFASPTFLVLAIPLLLSFSIWNTRRQEAHLVSVYGESYENYRASVPMLWPRLSHRR